jgi:glycosyltransferase involved in cell wall biosynthesis
MAERAGVGHQVTFTPLSHEAVPSFLQSLDVLVLPSVTTPTWKEQFGRVLVEAMACGTPVIASDSGAGPSVVGEPDLIFPERQPLMLRCRVDSLLSNPGLWAKARAYGLERARDFTWESVAIKTDAAYESVLRREAS